MRLSFAPTSVTLPSGWLISSRETDLNCQEQSSELPTWIWVQRIPQKPSSATNLRCLKENATPVFLNISVHTIATVLCFLSAERGGPPVRSSITPMRHKNYNFPYHQKRIIQNLPSLCRIENPKKYYQIKMSYE
jgi:hypothetical protein